MPKYIINNWVYIICWLVKDHCLKNPDDSRSMQQAIKQIECKVLDIFDKLAQYRLNLQVQKYLIQFRDFQEKNLDPHVDQCEEDFKIEEEYENLFKLHQFDIDIKQTDLFLNLKKQQMNFKKAKNAGKKKRKEVKTQ